MTSNAWAAPSDEEPKRSGTFFGDFFEILRNFFSAGVLDLGTIACQPGSFRREDWNSLARSTYGNHFLKTPFGIVSPGQRAGVGFAVRTIGKRISTARFLLP
jgi:hypothetical protein